MFMFHGLLYCLFAVQAEALCNSIGDDAESLPELVDEA